jgi:hypothetical protein
MFAIVFKCFCKCFRRMFQVFHLTFFYVVSVASECFKKDQVLHTECMWKAGGGMSGPCRRTSRAPAWPHETQCGRATFDRCGAMHGRAKTDYSRDMGVRPTPRR